MMPVPFRVGWKTLFIFYLCLLPRFVPPFSPPFISYVLAEPYKCCNVPLLSVLDLNLFSRHAWLLARKTDFHTANTQRASFFCNERAAQNRNRIFFCVSAWVEAMRSSHPPTKKKHTHLLFNSIPTLPHWRTMTVNLVMLRFVPTVHYPRRRVVAWDRNKIRQRFGAAMEREPTRQWIFFCLTIWQFANNWKAFFPHRTRHYQSPWTMQRTAKANVVSLGVGMV